MRSIEQYLLDKLCTYSDERIFNMRGLELFFWILVVKIFNWEEEIYGKN